MGKTILYSIFIVTTGIVMMPWILMLIVPIFLFAVDFYIMSNFFVILSKNEKDKSSNIRILMVDDTPSTLVILQKVLAEQSCYVTIVNSGKEAIEKLQREKYDLLIIDNYMQELNGPETLKQADILLSKNLEETGHFQIPVVEYASCIEENNSSLKSEFSNVVDFNNFKMISKLSKKIPTSKLRPIIDNILKEVKIKTG